MCKCLYEYDEEKHIRNERRIAFEEGEKSGAEKYKQRIEKAEKEAEMLKEELKRLREENLKLKEASNKKPNYNVESR